MKSSSPIVVQTTPKSYASSYASTSRPPFYSSSSATTPSTLDYNYQKPQEVFVRPHTDAIESKYLPSSRFGSFSSTTENPLYKQQHSSLETTHSNFLTPSSTPIALYSSTTESSSNYDETPISITQRPPYISFSKVSTKPGNEQAPPYSSHDLQQSVSSTTYRPPVAIIKDTNYPKVAPIESSSAKSIIPPNYSNNYIDNIQPLYQRPDPIYDPPQSYQYYKPTESSQSNQKYSSYNHNDYSQSTPDAPGYDGVSVTNNGFRYFLPRQYHEEENSGSSNRAGSFGYIDPFGIRRVVYYNTSPDGGFVHRKNNRYVGFNATPYDPRPSVNN